MRINDRNILIWLKSLGISNNNIMKIMLEYENLEEFWYIDSMTLNNLKGLTNTTKNKILRNKKKEILNRAVDESSVYKVVTILDEDYPNRLKNIPDMPMVLYMKGLDLKDDISMGIVGSRRSSDYGKWACNKFTKELVDLDVHIISGLALGIDAVAHRSAIEAGGYTVAVLGNGLDQVYPKRNLSLYEEIEKFGTMVTEYHPGTPPLAYNFPERNRIISGLSDALLVVEAKEKSGSLITAYHGLEQGRDIFALPGNINSIFSSGTNKLIKDGARPLLNIGDIIEEFGELKDRMSRKAELDIENPVFSESELKIITLLKEEPMHSDNIVYRTGMDISTINTMLIGLELKGYIEEVSNNVFTLC